MHRLSHSAAAETKPLTPEPHKNVFRNLKPRTKIFIALGAIVLVGVILGSVGLIKYGSNPSMKFKAIFGAVLGGSALSGFALIYLFRRQTNDSTDSDTMNDTLFSDDTLNKSVLNGEALELKISSLTDRQPHKIGNPSVFLANTPYLKLHDQEYTYVVIAADEGGFDEEHFLVFCDTAGYSYLRLNPVLANQCKNGTIGDTVLSHTFIPNSELASRQEAK